MQSSNLLNTDNAILTRQLNSILICYIDSFRQLFNLVRMSRMLTFLLQEMQFKYKYHSLSITYFDLEVVRLQINKKNLIKYNSALEENKVASFGRTVFYQKILSRTVQIAISKVVKLYYFLYYVIIGGKIILFLNQVFAEEYLH